MVKRYYGGLITSRKNTTQVGNFVSGIYNKNTHLQTTFAGAFPPYDLRDTYFKYTTLLLNGNPPSPTFVTDASTNSFPISVVGDTKPNNFNPYSAGYYSNYFDGTGDYLNTVAQSTLPSIGNIHTFVAGQDFTIEAWIYLTAAVTYQELLGVYSGGTNGRWIIRTGSDGKTLGLYQYPTISDVSFGVTLSLNKWYHIALVRSGTTTTGYVDGVGTLVYNGSYNIDGGAEAFYIGQAYPSRAPWNGFISNLRIVRNAVYTGNFTPPVAPLTTAGSSSAASYSNTVNVNTTFAAANTSLLTCLSNRLVDTGANSFVLTKNGDTRVNAFHPFISPQNSYASTYFDGTGDYLNFASNVALGYGTGDFEISFWYYPISASGYLFDHRTADSQTALTMYYDSGTLYLYVDGGYIITGTDPAKNTWHYLTVSRVSGTTRLFVDGAQLG
jgi:hypothetical protein